MDSVDTSDEIWAPTLLCSPPTTVLLSTSAAVLRVGNNFFIDGSSRGVNGSVDHMGGTTMRESEPVSGGGKDAPGLASINGTMTKNVDPRPSPSLSAQMRA
jgi:hypothetical protein